MKINGKFRINILFHATTRVHWLVDLFICIVTIDLYLLKIYSVLINVENEIRWI